MNHFDHSLIGLIAVAFREDVALRLDGETQTTNYRRNEVVSLPQTVGELLIRCGKAVAA